MSTHADEEILARALAAQVLKAPDWAARLDAICSAMREAAGRASTPAPHTPRTLRRVAIRAETILRHIARSDALTVGRLYFDLLPRDPAHPLSAAVVAALSDGRAVIRMLRESGTRFDVHKDGTGANYITVHDLDHAGGLGDGFKTAIIRALALTAHVGSPPQGGLHRIH
jgi:hypothetical protein